MNDEGLESHDAPDGWVWSEHIIPLPGGMLNQEDPRFAKMQTEIDRLWEIVRKQQEALQKSLESQGNMLQVLVMHEKELDEKR